jgi:integrase
MKTRKGYLIKRGKTYFAVWQIDGRKFMKTTRESDREKAQVELNKIMAPFVVEDTIRTLETVKSSIEGGKAELVAIDEERNPPIPISDSWVAFKDSPRRKNCGERTLREYESHWHQFEQWITKEYPGAKTLRDVTPAIVEAYATHLWKRKLSPNRYNKHARLLEYVFRVLKGRGRLLSNPWESIESKALTTNSRRELTIEELREICAKADGELRLLLALGIYTGLRLGDCATLRWGEVDLARGIIIRVPNKTARRNPKPVHIPIHMTLRTLLMEIPRTKHQVYVLPDMATRYAKGAYMLTDSIQEHFVTCGVSPYKPGTGFEMKPDEDGNPKRTHTGKRAVVEVGFHSLRHSFVSLCRGANAPLSVVEAIVGHSNPSMTRHYTHTGEAAALAAVSALPSVMGDSAPPLLESPRLVPAGPVLIGLEAMNDRNWKAKRDELISLLSKG